MRHQKIYRQGDVLLVRVPRVPKAATPQGAASRIVLAEGEVTGHAHTIDGRKAQVSLDEGGVMYVTIEELTEVRHQEHAPVTLEPGAYRVMRQREYAPDEIRNVAD